MKIQHVIAIAIKFIAILVFVYALRLIIWLTQEMLMPGFFNQGTGYYLIGSTILLVAFALACWFIPLTISKWLVKPAWNRDISDVHPGGLLRSLVLFLGLYLLVDAILDMTRFVYQLYWLESITDDSYQNNLKVSIAIIISQFIVGLFMLSKNYWITRALFKINAPDPKVNSDVPSQPD